MKNRRIVALWLLAILLTIITSLNETIYAQTNSSSKDTKVMNIEGTITVGSENFSVIYQDNPTVRSLIEQMPFMVELEDYANLEKIFYPDPALSTKNAPDGAEAIKGDVMYYAPWDDVAIFYKDFKYAKGLIPLGHIQQIDDLIEALNSTNTALFEIETDN